MQSLQFWKSWAKVYQRIGLIVGITFTLSLAFLWFAWFKAPAPVLEWMHIQEQELVQIPVHTFQQGLFELTVSGDSYLIFERLLGDTLKPNPTAGYLFLTVLVMSMIVLLTIITTLGRFYYLLGMGLFILFIVGFRMEIIQMFGLSNKVFTIIVLILYVIPTFYFQFFRSSTSFLIRLSVFTAITLLIGVVIINFATVRFPLLHLSVTGITAAFVISVVFIFTVAHEILASFIYVASQSTKQGKSLNHFLIISAIYMINLALAYAHKIGMINWDFMYINFYLLLTISGLLGIWGFHHRQPQYENIMPADPFGVYFFLSLGAICYATIGYFIGTANDSALAAMNDIIIYGHLGYGIIFITYVISNFFAVLAENLPAYKVLYKPNYMPYFTFRFGGLIATLAFVFYNTWQVPVQNAFSAYHNAAGDLYQTLGNSHYAEAFYQQAGVYGFLNHHSNYAIANIEGRKFNSIKERNYYDRASQRRPTEYSVLNLSQTFQRDGQWLDAMLALREGNRKIIDSGPVQNSLGLVYSKLNLVDSALFFLQKAMDHKITRAAAQTNFVGVAAKNNLNVPADSLLKLLTSDNLGTKSNALAFANLQNTKIDLEIDLKSDTVLNLFSASLIINYFLNHLGDLDTTTINQAIELAKKPINDDYREAVLYTTALACYAEGQVGKAFSLLEEVAILSSDQSKYNLILTLWALDQNAGQDAQAFSQYVLNQPNGGVIPVVAIALTEAGRIGEALVQWDSLRRSPDSTHHRHAQQMINALAATENLVNQFTDEEKFLYAKYRIPLGDSSKFYSLINQITRDELKARAILSRSMSLFEKDELSAAIATFNKVKGLQLTDKKLYDQIIHFELDLMASQNDLRTLSGRINEQGIEFGQAWKNQQIYFKALLSESNNVHETAALYRWLAVANPYHEDAVISAAQYFKKNGSDRLDGYNILTDALHANPYSVKLLKAYSLEAAGLGFNEYAQSALERLRPLLSSNAMKEFLLNNQVAFKQVL